MTANTPAGRLPLVPLGVLGLSITVAVASQLAPLVGQPPVDRFDNPAAVDEPAAPAAAALERERIAADIAFWSARLEADPGDLVSATRLAGAHLDSARASGDVTAYLRALGAADAALAAQPTYLPARTARATALVALHRFDEARAAARAILAERPTDPTALGVLGDASLELGDVAIARSAYLQLSVVADAAAGRVRRSHLAFLEGDTAGAVAAARSAVGGAVEEAIGGPALAWFHYQLGETLLATGDRAGAAVAYADALAADAASHLARSGLARIAAADGRLDDAIALLDDAIAAVPLPELVARRADLHALRGADGDAVREREDRATVLAIGALAGDAASVYDRSLSLYLSDYRIDVARALSLAESEIRVRRDIYGYDALAWALLANGRVDDAAAAMEKALALGTRDARLLYHAGTIAASRGDTAEARRQLADALAIDGSLDPVSAARARDTLAGLP